MNINPHSYGAYQLFHEGILALAQAERQGIRVDLQYIESKKAHLTRKIERLDEKFKDTDFFRHWQHATKGRININSNSQLAHFLYDIKKLKVEKETQSGQGATDDEALQQMNIPELNTLLEMRKLRKVRDTYLDAFAREQVDGIVHPFFNLHLVRTYRSSSDSPNFQNIPKRDEESMQMVRKAIFPRPGHQLMEIDYSGIEVRIAACYHKDSTMLHYINDPASDLHGDMAKQIFMVPDFNKKNPDHYVLRQAAKNGFVFPEFYGDYYGNCAINMACRWGLLPQQGEWTGGLGIPLNGKTLSDHLIAKGITSLDDFSEHLKKIEGNFWGKRFAEYAAWKDLWWNLYQKYGYIDLLTGFRCYGQMGKNDCINYPVQGAAFHCLLWSFIELNYFLRKYDFDSRLVGQIHDSMILDVNPLEVDQIREMAQQITCQDLPAAWKWIITPMEVEFELSPIDASWAEKQKII